MSYIVEFIKKENRGILCDDKKWYNYTQYQDTIVNKLNKGDEVDFEFWESGKVKTIIPLTKNFVPDTRPYVKYVPKPDNGNYAKDFTDLEDKALDQAKEKKSSYDVKNDLDKLRFEFDKYKQEVITKEALYNTATEITRDMEYKFVDSRFAAVEKIAHDLYRDLHTDWSKYKEQAPDTKVNDSKL